MSEETKTVELTEAAKKRIAALEAELKLLKEGPVVVELTDEEKETGLHASNAPHPAPKIVEGTPGHDGYYPPKAVKKDA